MENYPWIIYNTPLYLELWILEYISDFFSLLSFQTHDLLAKASVLTTVILRTDLKIFHKEKWNKLKKKNFYDFFWEVWNSWKGL